MYDEVSSHFSCATRTSSSPAGMVFLVPLSNERSSPERSRALVWPAPWSSSTQWPNSVTLSFVARVNGETHAVGCAPSLAFCTAKV